jgi:glycosyltransferase involved in cell wall biosynthesis
MPSALKVLHVYSGNLLGGLERMLISLTTLDATVCEHEFALCFEGRLSQALQTRGASVRLLGPVRLRSPLSIVRARRALARLLRSRRFDAVICHSIWPYCIFSSVGAHQGYAPILYLHDVPDPKSWYYRWGWRNPPRLCIANSTYTEGLVSSLHPIVPVRVVTPLVNPPRSFDAAQAAELRARWGAKPGDIIILQAGRFGPGKGHHNLLRALHAVKDLASWRCWLAGAPQRPLEQTYQRELSELAGSLGIADRISFIGHRDDMDAVLATCDIYCQPNETPETFGMVFVEALYAGKPVLGSALGGALDIVTPDCGILCPPDAGLLAVALRRLLNDHQLRAEMASRGPARAAQLCGAELFTTRFRDALAAVKA